MKKLITAAFLLAGGIGLLHALGLNGLVINEPGLAYSKRIVLNLAANNVTTLSATAAYSSTTFHTSTFSTGQISTGSITIVSNTLLTPASATNHITVTSTAGAANSSIVVPFTTKPGAYVFLSGRQWNYKATTALTAASIASALATVPWLSVSVAGNVIYTTATAGAFYNGVPLTTNSAGTLTVANPTFTGGNSAAVFYVNGYAFQANRDFVVGGSAGTSATNLSNAINAKNTLNGWVLAAPSSAVVNLQSKKAGAIYNFPLATSNTSAGTVSAAALYGGLTPAWNVNSGAISLTNHGFTLALPVLYTLGSGAPAIGGLTGNATYYVVPIDANTVGLSSTSAVAQTGVYITLTSSSTLTAAKNYSLAPLAWVTGSAGFDWEVANAATGPWTPLNVSSVTYSSPGTMAWDFGPVGFSFLSLNVTGPTSGGLGIQVTAQSN